MTKTGFGSGRTDMGGLGHGGKDEISDQTRSGAVWRGCHIAGREL